MVMGPSAKLKTSSLLLAFFGLFSSCVYRFTNSHVGRLAGMRTVAVESVYDTSSESLPHEVIWEALQRAFAADGHLKLVSRTEADILIRAHITSGSVTPSAPFDRGPDKDPQVFLGGSPPRPTTFKRLTVAREHATRENASISIAVEAYQLHSGKLLMSKSYAAAKGFGSLPSSGPLTYSFIRHEEAIINQVDLAANEIASQVVRDFLAISGG